MSSVKKLQINKAIQNNIITKKEASFIMSLINITTSLDDAILNIEHYGERIKIANPVCLNGYSLDDHIAFSYVILDKISSISISTEELTNMINM